MTEMTTLYRPVGQQELDLIQSGGYREFPPRLPHQPIFYPVLGGMKSKPSAPRFIRSTGFLLNTCRNSIATSSGRSKSSQSFIDS